MQLVITIIIITIILLLFFNICIMVDKKEGKSNRKSRIIDQTIQEMFDILGANVTGDEKLNDLNKVLLDVFNARYSSLILYDGNHYQVKASNVEKEFMDAISDIAKEDMFRSYITKNVSKYIIGKDGKNLTYRSALERRICSVIFSPIYYNDVYLGYWLIEDDEENTFEGIKEEELARFKHNLSVFIENIQVQNTIEIAENTDKQTGLYNNVYLYSNARTIVTANETSAMTILCLKNIPEINERYDRNLGNKLIQKIVNSMKDMVSKESILIRYSGIRFLIITPGSDAQIAQPIMERLLSRIKNEFEYVGDKKVTVDTQMLIHTLKKQNNIEKELQSLVCYIDHMKVVNTIKII